ncbi:hypothetical protein LIS04_216 [Listeria phage LIS04]|nr:hypothetical protein LIS04_216 [Listeria phage LIS04]
MSKKSSYQKFKESGAQDTIEIHGNTVSLSSIKPRSLSLKDYRSIRANSQQRAELLPKLSNEALVEVSKFYLNNIPTVSDPVTYEEALSSHVVPELLKRLR